MNVANADDDYEKYDDEKNGYYVQHENGWDEGEEGIRDVH
jgi:hypothetical protein